MTRRGTLLDGALLGAVLLVYAALSLPQLELPGLYYDEAVDAVPAMQLLERQPVTLVRGAGLRVGSRDLPLMAMDYVGAVHTYAALPFFGAFGVGAVPLRLMTVTGGGVTVALTYLLGRALFGRGPATLAAALLAVHPSFIFYVRQGVHVSSLLSVMTVGSLLALWRWRRTGSTLALLAGSFLLGLGLWTKILFLWHLVVVLALGALDLLRQAAGQTRQPRATAALPVLMAMANVDPTARPPSLLSFHPAPAAATRPWAGVRALLQAALALTAFLAGTWPLLLYNGLTGGTVDVILKNSGQTQGGVDNAAVLANLGTRLESLRVLLTGGHFWWLGGLFSADWYPHVVAALLATLPFLLAAHRSRFPGLALPAGALALLVALVLGQSIFTVSGIWPTHLFAFLPFVLLLTALALVLLARLSFIRPLPQFAAVALAVGLIGGAVWTTVQYHQALAETGGRRAQSDAIYRLAAYLERMPSAGPVMLMDWGISASVELLTHGRVPVQEAFFYALEPPPMFTDWIYGALTGPGPRYFVFHPPESTVYRGRFEAWAALAQHVGKQVELVETVRERDGTPAYLVYAVR